MRLLIIEDDTALSGALKLHLEREGYSIDVCGDGSEAFYYLDEGEYGAMILDRMLPGEDGLSILRRLRESGSNIPVLMLTALSAVRDRTDGLDAGADDYLVKPFAIAMEELLSRVRALLRRPAALRSGVLTFGELTLDARQCRLSFKKESLSLSKKEAALFEFFFENPEDVLSRAQILSRVWGSDELVEEGNVDNYIYFARRRLKALCVPASIKTVHGVGYALVESLELRT